MKKLFSLIIGLLITSSFGFRVSSFVNADDFVPAEEEENSSNTFILDADNTGGDIKIQFGNSLGF